MDIVELKITAFHQHSVIFLLMIQQIKKKQRNEKKYNIGLNTMLLCTSYILTPLNMNNHENKCCMKYKK